MKHTLMAVAAALSFAAFAEEPACKDCAVAEKAPTCAAKEGPRARPLRGPHQTMPSIEPIVRAVVDPKVAEKVGLSEDQVAKLKVLAEDRKGLKELNERQRAGMARQAELLKAEKVDEAAVMATLDEVWEVRKEIAKFQIKRVIAVRAILTPEQIKAVGEVLRERRANGKGPRAKKPPKAGK